MALADYKVNRSTRRCCIENRELRDGEWYFSVVIEDGDQLVRRDYSAAAWSGPPDGAIGWWKCRMPEAGQRKLVLAPDAVLVDHLRRMSADPQQSALCFLLALTLLRRRIVRVVPSQPGTEQDRPAGSMRLQIIVDGSEIEIEEVEITRRQAESLTEALQELLYCEASD